MLNCFRRLGIEGYSLRLRELIGETGCNVLLEDGESDDISRLAEEAAEGSRAVAAALAADSGLRKALLQVSSRMSQAAWSTA